MEYVPTVKEFFTGYNNLKESWFFFDIAGTDYLTNFNSISFTFYLSFSAILIFLLFPQKSRIKGIFLNIFPMLLASCLIKFFYLYLKNQSYHRYLAFSWFNNKYIKMEKMLMVLFIVFSLYFLITSFSLNFSLGGIGASLSLLWFDAVISQEVLFEVFSDLSGKFWFIKPFMTTNTLDFLQYIIPLFVGFYVIIWLYQFWSTSGLNYIKYGLKHTRRRLSSDDLEPKIPPKSRGKYSGALYDRDEPYFYI